MSAAPLKPSEQELLSALLDDALEGAERKQAEALLLRAEAREYLHELRATRLLVRKHAAVRAPVGLSARVMGALEGGFDDVSRPVNNQAAPAAKLHQIGSFSWRAPLFAAAAVFVVSVSVIFGPSLFRSNEASDTSIARDVLEQGRGASPDRTGEVFSRETGPVIPAPEADALEAAERRQAKEPGSNWNAVESTAEKLGKEGLKEELAEGEASPQKNSTDVVGRMRADADKDRNARSDPKDPAESGDSAKANKKTNEEERTKLADGEGSPKLKKDYGSAKGLGGGTGGGGSSGGGQGDTGPQPEGKVGSPHGNPRAGGLPAPRPPAPAPAEPARDENADDPADREAAKPAAEAGKDGGTDKKAGEKAGEKAEDSKSPESSDAGSGQDAQNDAEGAETARKNTDRGSDDSGGSAGGTRRYEDQGGAEAPGSQPAQQALEAMTLELTDKDELLAAQSDLLWVAFLHGKAELDEEGNVQITVDAKRRDALLKALQRLNAEQAYGKLSGEAATIEPAGSDTAGPAGYLPKAVNEAGTTVRMTITLK